MLVGYPKMEQQHLHSKEREAAWGLAAVAKPSTHCTRWQGDAVIGNWVQGDAQPLA